MAALSPTATIGGWLVAETLQPPSYSPQPGPTDGQALVVTEAIGAGGVDAMILSSAGSWRRHLRDHRHRLQPSPIA